MKKTKALVDLTAAWANAKNRQDDAEREVEDLKAKILAAGGTIGYRDGFLEITATPRVEGQRTITILQNDALDKALVEERQHTKASETHVSAEKVRSLAKLHPAIAEAVEAITTRDTPRFLRAKAL